jgi:hypothetical protein
MWRSVCALAFLLGSTITAGILGGCGTLEQQGAVVNGNASGALPAPVQLEPQAPKERAGSTVCAVGP